MESKDTFNVHEKLLLSKNKENTLIVNNYMPEGVEFDPKDSGGCVDMTNATLQSGQKTDTTITKKEHHLRTIAIIIVVFIGIFFFWIMSSKNNDGTRKKKSINLDSKQTESIVKTESRPITATDIENTITGGNNNPNGPTNTSPADHKGFKLGDKVTYRDGAVVSSAGNDTSVDIKRNYNTPLYVKADGSGYGSGSAIRSPRLSLPKNSYVRAYLEREITSQNLDIPITAVCYMDMTYNGKILIPSGSKLIGVADYSRGNRVGAYFKGVVFPNGNEYSINGVALGEDNGAGLAANIDHKLGKKGTSIMASSLLDAASTTLSITGDSFGSALAGSVAGNTSDEMDNAINDSSRNTRASVSVPANTRFKVCFE